MIVIKLSRVELVFDREKEKQKEIEREIEREREKKKSFRWNLQIKIALKDNLKKCRVKWVRLDWCIIHFLHSSFLFLALSLKCFSVSLSFWLFLLTVWFSLAWKSISPTGFLFCFPFSCASSASRFWIFCKQWPLAGKFFEFEYSPKIRHFWRIWVLAKMIILGNWPDLIHLLIFANLFWSDSIHSSTFATLLCPDSIHSSTFANLFWLDSIHSPA